MLALSLAAIFALPVLQLAAAPSAGAVGSLWSIRIGSFELADPLAVSSFAVAARRIDFWAAIAAPLILTMLFGRFFCGWLCPARLPVELAQLVRARLPRRWRHGRLRLPRLRLAKYAVLVVGLAAAALTGWNLLAIIYPPSIFAREAYVLLAYGTLGAGALWLAAAFVVDLVVESGAWCRGLCPGGALYSLVGALAPLKMRLEESRCVTCPLCRRACPLGLDPTSDRHHAECDRCGLCQRACPKDALLYELNVRRESR